MSTRDELIYTVGQAMGAAWTDETGYALAPRTVADHLLIQGWRPPAREITTVEELEALPNNEERAIPQEAVEAACNAFQRPNRMLINTSDGNLKGRLEAAFEAAEPHLRRKWAEEVLDEGILGAGYSVLMNPNRGEHPVTTFTRAVKHMLDLLEGATE